MQGVEVGRCVRLHPDDDSDLFEDDVVVVPTVHLDAVALVPAVLHSLQGKEPQLVLVIGCRSSSGRRTNTRGEKEE